MAREKVLGFNLAFLPHLDHLFVTTGLKDVQAEVKGEKVTEIEKRKQDGTGS